MGAWFWRGAGGTGEGPVAVAASATDVPRFDLSERPVRSRAGANQRVHSGPISTPLLGMMAFYGARRERPHGPHPGSRRRTQNGQAAGPDAPARRAPARPPS